MILYALAPIDFIPELFLGPFGLIDDAIAGMTIVRNMSLLLINFVREERLRNNNFS